MLKRLPFNKLSKEGKIIRIKSYVRDIISNIVLLGKIIALYIFLIYVLDYLF